MPHAVLADVARGAASAPRIVAGTVALVQNVKCVAALASVGDRGQCDFRGALGHSERQGLAGLARAKFRPSAGALSEAAE